MSYTVIITEEVAANVAVTTQNYPITIEYNATNIAANTSYGNTEVAAYLASGTDTANITTTAQLNGGNVVSTGYVTAGGNIVGANLLTGGAVTASGNITAAYFIGNGSQLTGLSANYSNANVQAYLPTYSGNIGALTVTGNLTVTGSTTTVNTEIVNVNETVTGNVDAGNLRTTGQVSATGNITGGNVIAPIWTNAITGVTANGNIDIAPDGTGHVNINADVLRIGDNNSPAVIASRGTGNLTLQAHEGDTAQSNVRIVEGVNGNVEINLNGTGNLNTARISASGNVTAAYFAGNGSTLSSITGANVSGTVANATYATSAGSATTATLATYATTANAVAGANVSGTVANATYATSAGSATTATSATSATTAGTVTTAAQANITSVGTLTSLSVSGNVTGGNVVVPNGSKYRGDFTSGGTAGRSFFQTTDTSTSAPTFVSAIPGPNHIATPGTIGSATGLFSTNDGGNASIFGMYSYPTDAAIRSLSTGTGNINDITFKFGTGSTLAATITQGGNITAVGNLSSTQQTIVGTANVGTTSNIIISGKNIATDMAFAPNGANTTNIYNGRISIGTGFNGNTSFGGGTRVSVMDTIVRDNTNTNVRAIDIDSIVSLTGNVTNGSFRQQGLGSRLRVGGGSSGNSINLAGGGGQNNAVAALQPNIDVGNVAPYNLGNATVSHATLNGGFFTLYPGGNIGNAYGMLPSMIAQSDGNAAAVGNITNYIGFGTSAQAAPSVVGNLYAFYHPNVSNSAEHTATGLGMSAAARKAPNYYAFRNDDDVAQVKLGSLRAYHEYQYSTATSGTVNIDKNNAQIQYIAPTANVTVGSFQNFVTTASNSASSLNQTDTVTLIIKQGATPYTVSMPTGNASIKYASGNSTVGTTANAVTMINITGSNIGGAAMYLVTISPEFT